MKKMRKVLCFLLVFAQIFCITQPVSAATVSAKNKEKFKNIIWNQTYRNDDLPILLANASYLLKDLNKDGQKELFVTADLGIKNLYGTRVYSSYKGKLVKTSVDGEITKISTKGFLTSERDYENGVSESMTYCIYTIGSNGKAKLEAKKIYYIEYNNGSQAGKYKETTTYYNGSNKKIKKSKYNAIYKKYKFKKVTTYNSADHKKLLSLFGTTKTPKLADGSYWSCPTSKEEFKKWYLYSIYNYKLPDISKAVIRGKYIYIYGQIWSKDSKIKKSGNVYKMKLDSNYKIYYLNGDEGTLSSDIKTFNRYADSSNSEHVTGLYFTVKNNKVTKISCGY